MLFRMFAETVFLGPFAAEPMSVCHTQVYSERRPQVKRTGHLIGGLAIAFTIMTLIY